MKRHSHQLRVIRTTRTNLSLANSLDLDLHHMDVESAFLNGDLKEDIYLKPADGFRRI
jgi:hypothetical protein